MVGLVGHKFGTSALATRTTKPPLATTQVGLTGTSIDWELGRRAFDLTGCAAFAPHSCNRDDGGVYGHVNSFGNR